MKLITKAFNFRIHPTKEQEILINKTFGCTRMVHNFFLNDSINFYEKEGFRPTYSDTAYVLKHDLKPNFPYLKEVDSTSLQNTLKDQDQGFNNFFRRCENNEKEKGFPNFKSKKDNRQKYRSTNNKTTAGSTIEVLDGFIKLPKLGLVKCKISKQVQGQILNATIERNPSGKHFISICCKDVPFIPHEGTGGAIALDLGITHLATTSNETRIENHKYYRKSQKRLRKKQKSLSRKSKGSKNYNKARIELAEQHAKISNQRKDHIHNKTTELVKENDFIIVEDLNVKGMARNKNLSKSIYDAGWGEFVRQLEYKSDWHNKTLVKVDRFFPSSQLCNKCGFKNPEVKDLSIREWKCPNCGVLLDRDFNAAMNLLNEGVRIITVA